MTAGARLSTPARTLRSSAIGAWLGPAALVAGLAAVVASRWLATRAGLDPLLVGAGFGLALAAVIGWGSRSHGDRRAPVPAHARTEGRVVAAGALTVADGRADSGGRAATLARAAAIGAGFGIALVGIAVLGPVLAGTAAVPGLGRPAAPFVAWAAITILVVAAEEGLLRGVLFDRLERAGGVAAAVFVTSAVFALMHVPLYGWHVVPLDLAVGIGLAGTRLAARTLLAPIVAHAIADLATWWL